MPGVVAYFDNFVRSPYERELLEKMASMLVPLMGDLGKVCAFPADFVRPRFLSYNSSVRGFCLTILFRK